jgi:hypothetical protein
VTRFYLFHHQPQLHFTSLPSSPSIRNPTELINVKRHTRTQKKCPTNPKSVPTTTNPTTSSSTTTTTVAAQRKPKRQHRQAHNPHQLKRQTRMAMYTGTSRAIAESQFPNSKGRVWSVLESIMRRMGRNFLGRRYSPSPQCLRLEFLLDGQRADIVTVGFV